MEPRIKPIKGPVNNNLRRAGKTLFKSYTT